MRRPIRQVVITPLATLDAIEPQALIAVGLVVLIAVAIWPAIPAVTAMALVTLGATRITLQRLRTEATALPWMLIHLTVYGTLYGVFIAASLHSVSSKVHSAHSRGLLFFGPYTPYLFTSIDLALSTLPIALALRQVFGVFRDDSLTV